MQKNWQSEWLGIDFKDFGSLNPNSLPDKQFYERFYIAFYKKFSSFDMLPKKWRDSKKQVAEDIISYFGNKKLLSVGYGIGFIENKILNILKKKSNSNLNIHAIDPSLPSLHWLNKEIQFSKRYFPEVIKKFMLADLHTGHKKWNFKTLIKELGKRILIFLRISKVQFWGYLRGIDDHLILLQKAGFSKFQVGQHKNLKTNCLVVTL